MRSGFGRGVDAKHAGQVLACEHFVGRTGSYYGTGIHQQQAVGEASRLFEVVHNGQHRFGGRLALLQVLKKRKAVLNIQVGGGFVKEPGSRLLHKRLRQNARWRSPPLSDGTARLPRCAMFIASSAAVTRSRSPR